MNGTALHEHLAGGTTTVCRAWILRRRDGRVFGFTDHDRDLTVDGVLCRADTGLTARALQQSTGLSVDNSEALGAFNDGAIREADLVAGRFDGAEVSAYLVNWAVPEQRVEQFRGSLGEVTHAGGAFRAELRGLAELLNREQGLVYQSGCSAVLGDRRCRFDLSAPGYSAELVVETVADGRLFRFAEAGIAADHWFDLGRLEVLSGEAAGLVGLIRSDRISDGARVVELWQSLRAEMQPGDRCRLLAGCDKTLGSCRVKFGNVLNYRGFPHIPSEDLLTSYPVPDRPNTGGPRQPMLPQLPPLPPLPPLPQLPT